MLGTARAAAQRRAAAAALAAGFPAAHGGCRSRLGGRRYTDAWDGDKYKGSSFNILTVLLAISILTPLLGLVFAYKTYGVLWG